MNISWSKSKFSLDQLLTTRLNLQHRWTSSLANLASSVDHGMTNPPWNSLSWHLWRDHPRKIIFKSWESKGTHVNHPLIRTYFPGGWHSGGAPLDFHDQTLLCRCVRLGERWWNLIPSHEDVFSRMNKQFWSYVHEEKTHLSKCLFSFKNQWHLLARWFRCATRYHLNILLANLNHRG